MKKALVFVLSAVLALGTVTPVLADDGNGENGYDEITYYENGEEPVEAVDAEIETEEQAELPALLPAVGKIGYITEYTENQLTVVSQFNEDDVIVLNLGEGTVIIDAETGSPAVIADRTSDRVKVYHAAFTTRSIPPQSPALVVAIDLPEYASSPHYHVIEAIEWAGEDAVRLLVDNGSLYITLDRAVPLFPHLTRQMVALEHLQVGDTLLFWYEVVLLSLPGQTTATRALWLSAAAVEEGEIEAIVDDEEADETGVVIIDEAILPEPIVDEVPAVEPPVNIAVPGTGVMRNGVEFFPVRALAVEAGFSVAWESATRSAVLTADGVMIRVADSATAVYVNGAAPSLSAAVFIENGVMYAPYDFFAHLG